jgi:hypothetical protein
MATVYIPNSFVAGTPAVATEVNQNFTAITDQVNGNLNADNLVDGGVTASKLAPDSVTTSKISNLQVTDAKVAAGISATKIADGSVSDASFQYLSGVTSDIQSQLDTFDGDWVGEQISDRPPTTTNAPIGTYVLARIINVDPVHGPYALSAGMANSSENLAPSAADGTPGGSAFAAGASYTCCGAGAAGDVTLFLRTG